jgi:CheY-like chemotaxis protein
MQIDDPSLKGPAQRALLRVLRIAVPDEGQLRRVLTTALLAGRRNELPCDADELLRFVRTYLTPPLARVVAPNLVLAMLDDLIAEIEVQKASGAASGPRLRTTTRLPSAATALPPKASEPPPEPDRSETRGRAPFPKLSESVANLVRTASAKLPLARPAAAETTPAPSGFSPRRPPVVVVDSDRLARASLSRALVSARYDVTALDSAGEMLETLEATGPRVVVIVNAQEEGIVAALRAVVRVHPALPVLGFTAAPHDVTESLLATAGVVHLLVASKGAPMAEMIEGVRKLTHETDPWAEAKRGASEGERGG